MAIFAIIPQPNTDRARIDSALQLHYADDHFKLDGDTGWLVSARTSAQSLASQIGIGGDDPNAGLAVEVKSYWGRANPNIWTWLKEKIESSNG